MPENVRKEFLRALEFHRRGLLDSAEKAYLALLRNTPDHFSSLHNLGVMFAQNHKPKKAILYFDQAIAAFPDYAEAYNNKGNALLTIGHLHLAIGNYRKALQISPDYSEASLNLANGLMRLNCHKEALEIFTNLRGISTHIYRAKFNSGIANLALGNLDDANDLFLQTMEMRQLEIHSKYYKDTYSSTTKSKLLHDLEQFKYLSNFSEEDNNFIELAAEYENIINDVDWNKTSEKVVQLTKAQQLRIAGSYNKLLHHRFTPKLKNRAINSLINADTISKQYFNNQPNLAYFDDFLSREASIQLGRFLLESTIWHDFRHVDGYLAAYLENGLSTPLLLQIAFEVKEKFPDILRDLPLTQVWAFKDLQGDKGINVHADSGVVTLNFWLTPNEANLDQNHGGLVIYEATPPKNWHPTDYSKDITFIKDHLSRVDSKSTQIPYRENRAVLFKSGLFHRSDSIKFKTEYVNHRINISMIFGYGRSI